MSVNFDSDLFRANTFGKFQTTTLNSSFPGNKFYEQPNSISIYFIRNIGVDYQDYTLTYVDLEQTLNKYRRSNPSLINQVQNFKENEFKYNITTRSIQQKGEYQPIQTQQKYQQQTANANNNDKIEQEIGRIKTDEDEDISKILEVQRQVFDIKKEFDEMKRNNRPLSNDGSSFFQTYQALSNHKSPSAQKQAAVPMIEAQNLNYQFAQENVTTPNANYLNIMNNNAFQTVAPTNQQKKTFSFEKPSNGYVIPADYSNFTSEHTPPQTRYAFIVDQFGSDQQYSGDKNNNSASYLSLSQNVYKSSTVKKEDQKDGEDLKLSDLDTYTAYQINPANQQPIILVQSIRPDQLQHLSIIKEEEDDSLVDLQQLSFQSSKFKGLNVNMQNSLSSLNRNTADKRDSLSSRRSQKASPNSSFDNQFKMSQVSQNQSILDKIAEIDKKVKLALSKNEKKA